MSKSEERSNDDIESHQSFDGTLGTASASLSSQSVSSGRRNIRRFRRSTRRLGFLGGDALRTRYLYRLGIGVLDGSDGQSAHDGCTSKALDIQEVKPSPSLPAQVNLMANLHSPSLSQSPESAQTSKMHTRSSTNDKPEGKVLLRTSVQYTTELKFDKSDPTDIEKTSQHSNNSITPSLSPSSSASKFELSTAWTHHLLAIGEHLEEGTHGKQQPDEEPLDGAFDLFSLPSDSSVAVPRGMTGTSAASADSLTEASTSVYSHTPEFLSTSFSFQSIYREINRVQSMSLSDHSLQPRRKVSFDSTVKATTIPARSSYSKRVRTKLWSSSEDIVNNAIRNEYEFSYDGSDWRKIREEKDFISVAPSSDEKLHPAHFYGWSRSASKLSVEDNLLERGESSSDDDDGSDLHFCGVFGMEMNAE
eukprot:CCRYP_011625-RA/>CCRYP_011625-RA protein AED:0.17 eAED:-0.24 QI:0/-1/0/1/-1/1/1/0/418